MTTAKKKFSLGYKMKVLSGWRVWATGGGDKHFGGGESTGGVSIFSD